MFLDILFYIGIVGVHLLNVLTKYAYLLLNTHYTVVDSLKPTEIVVSFSSLSYWNEPAVTATKEETKPVSKLGVRDAKNDRDSRLGDAASDLNFAQDAQPNVSGNSCL